MNQYTVDPLVWKTAKLEFAAFVAGRTGLPQPVVMRMQIGTMDQEVVEADVDGLAVRLVCDRGSVFVDIRVFDSWCSAQLLLDFLDGRPADSVAAADIAPRDVWARWPDVLKAAGDRASLSQYQELADEAAIERFNTLASNSFDTPIRSHPEHDRLPATRFEEMMKLLRSPAAHDGQGTEQAARPAPGKRSSTG